MHIKNIKEIDNIANQIFCHKSHMLSVDLNEYELLKENSSSVEAFKIDIPILTNESIASIEDCFKTIDQDIISSGIFYICENNIITMDQLDMLLSLVSKHFDIENFICGLNGTSIYPKGAEIYIIIGLK